MAAIYRLTPKEIEAKKARGRLSDGGGLFLQVTDWKGIVSRSWEYRFTMHGKNRSMGLNLPALPPKCRVRFSTAGLKKAWRPA